MQNKNNCAGQISVSCPHKGFTLVELLVVVLIIAILAAVALPQYQRAVLKSRYVQAKTMTQAMATAAKLFHMANGGWTLNFDELSIDVTNGATSVQDNVAYFSWGYCHLACSGQCGGCYVNIGDAGKIGYWQEPFLTDKAACIVLDSASDVVKQICQSETNKTSGTHSSMGWTAYWY